MSITYIFVCFYCRALDYIFPFAKDVNESTPVFTDDQHKAVIRDIELMQYSATTNDFAVKWCSDLAKVRDSLLYNSLMNCSIHSIVNIDGHPKLERRQTGYS
jgi:hypothetical protein